MLPILLVLLVISYSLALKKTVQVYQNYTLLQSEATGSENLSVSPMYTHSRIKAVNELYHRFQVDTLSWKNSLWNMGAGLSQKYNSTVKAFPPVKTATIQEQLYFKQNIAFEGDFPNLLKLLKEMSFMRNAGMPAAIKFGKKNREEQVTLNIDLLALPR